MLLLTVIVLTMSVSAAADKPVPVPVYITSAGAVNGFTDPDKGSGDTVKDLKRALKSYKSMVLIDDRSAATLVLVVAGREATGSNGLGRDRVIRATLHFAQQESELSASRAGGAIGSSGAWRDAAMKMMKELDKWVKANRAQLAR